MSPGNIGDQAKRRLVVLNVSFVARDPTATSACPGRKQDGGTYQRSVFYEAMQSKACTNMIGCHPVEGAGHWVQQEQPRKVSRLLLQFLHRAAARSAN
jgi:pimeloyl-ACP methyl ester carboxylesterase